MALRTNVKTGANVDKARRRGPAKQTTALLLGSTRLQRDPEFTWASGGRPYAERSAGNGQRPDDGTWGLWYSPVRPAATRLRSRRRAG